MSFISLMEESCCSTTWIAAIFWMGMGDRRARISLQGEDWIFF